MEIQLITIAELTAFVESGVFKDLEQVPITPLRAYAQSINPRANENDLALVCAWSESQKLLAYFGCLPDELTEDPGKKVCWSSCWWADPEEGKSAVMPVFYKALQVWNGEMLFDALPERSKMILERMGHFNFRPIAGIQWMIRFKLHKALVRRFAWLHGIKGVLRLMDRALNLPVSFRIRRWRLSSPLPSTIWVEPIKRIDAATNDFIQALSENDLVHRDAASFNWVLENPWLSSDTSFEDRYHFSSHADHFENQLFRVFDQEKMIGFLWLTFRDGTAKLPFCYVQPGCEALIVQVLLDQLALLPVESFICYQQNILKELESRPGYFFRKKSLTKILGWTKTLDAHCSGEVYVQDGDGDMVFT